MLTPFFIIHHFNISKEKEMKRFEELVIGVLLFYLVDRGTRLISSIIADQREMNTMATEKFRCTIETFTMLVLFAFLWLRLKK
jgi:hypothetical protein